MPVTVISIYRSHCRWLSAKCSAPVPGMWPWKPGGSQPGLSACTRIHILRVLGLVLPGTVWAIYYVDKYVIFRMFMPVHNVIYHITKIYTAQKANSTGMVGTTGRLENQLNTNSKGGKQCPKHGSSLLTDFPGSLGSCRNDSGLPVRAGEEILFYRK